MKRIWLWIITILLAWTVTAEAKTAKEILDSLSTEINQAVSENDQLMAQSDALDKEEQDLIQLSNSQEEAERVYVESVNTYNRDYANYVNDSDRYEAEVKVHNDNPPDNTDEGAVNAYNAEANQFDAWANQLDNEEIRLEQKASDLDWTAEQLTKSRNRLNDEILDWTARKKQLNADLDECQAKLADLKKRTTNQCLELLKDPEALNDAIAWGCGEFFDGSDPSLPTLQDLGITTPFDK